jgi:DNA-binding NarL/FixJ family response regulator
MQESSTRQPQSFSGGDGVVENGRPGRQILYIDDQCVTRDCISHVLAELLPDLSIEARAKAQDLVSGNSRADGFALVVLHGHGGRIDLRTNAARIADSRIIAELSILDEIAPDTPLVLLSDVETAQNVIEAFRRRIRGYVPTTLPIKQVAEAIRFAWAGGTFVPLSILSQCGPADPVKNGPLSAPPVVPGNFSPRQCEVLHGLWMGKSNKTIAYDLSMCESTVKVHIRQIMKKLHATNRTQVVVRTRPSSFDGIESRGPMHSATNVLASGGSSIPPARQVQPVRPVNDPLVTKNGRIAS